MRRSRDVTRFCQLLCANTAPIRMMLVWMEETSRSTHSRGQPSTIIASASDQRQRLGLALRTYPIARGASPRCQLFTGCSQAKPAAVTCGGNFLGRVISYVGTRTSINGRAQTVLAPLVRVASRFHLVQPIRNPTAGVARIFRTEMD